MLITRRYVYVVEYYSYFPCCSELVYFAYADPTTICLLTHTHVYIYVSHGFYHRQTDVGALCGQYFTMTTAPKSPNRVPSPNHCRKI